MHNYHEESIIHIIMDYIRSYIKTKPTIMHIRFSYLIHLKLNS
jgi:hypothetical protein